MSLQLLVLPAYCLQRCPQVWKPAAGGNYFRITVVLLARVAMRTQAATIVLRASTTTISSIRSTVTHVPRASIKAAMGSHTATAVPLASIKAALGSQAATAVLLANIKRPLDSLDVLDAVVQVIFSQLFTFHHTLMC